MSESDKTCNADSRVIHWLLHESGVSRYKISKDTGISESALSRMASGETQMGSINFGFAISLTKYAHSLKDSAKNGLKGD